MERKGQGTRYPYALGKSWWNVSHLYYRPWLLFLGLGQVPVGILPAGYASSVYAFETFQGSGCIADYSGRHIRTDVTNDLE